MCIAAPGTSSFRALGILPVTESNIDAHHVQIQGLALSCVIWHAGGAVRTGPRVTIHHGEQSEAGSCRVCTVHLTLSSILPNIFSLLYFYNDVVKYVQWIYIATQGIKEDLFDFMGQDSVNILL